MTITGIGATSRALVHHGDVLDILPTLADGSVDAVVTDPPYELGFMGRAWDASGIAYSVDLWKQCFRVLKPGGHLLAFGGTRTSHRLTCAIEDAGFEIRDEIAWLYGSGFPKSLDVGKAIDKSGTPDDAKRWAGWGTALKPAHETIVVARKPLAGTVAGNVLAHGTGALHIDACRIEHASDVDLATSLAKNPGRTDLVTSGTYGADRPQQSVNTAGRWPTNVVLTHAATPDGFDLCGNGCVDGCPVAELDAQSGASRFFPVFCYQAKAPTRERPKVNGVAHPTVKPVELMRWLVRLVTPSGGIVLEPFAGSGTTVEACALEGVHCLAVERDASYLPLIEQRMQRAGLAINP